VAGIALQAHLFNVLEVIEGDRLFVGGRAVARRHTDRDAQDQGYPKTDGAGSTSWAKGPPGLAGWNLVGSAHWQMP
jgi:hypothetical protein